MYSWPSLIMHCDRPLQQQFCVKQVEKTSKMSQLWLIYLFLWMTSDTENKGAALNMYYSSHWPSEEFWLWRWPTQQHSVVWMMRSGSDVRRTEKWLLRDVSEEDLRGQAPLVPPQRGHGLDALQTERPRGGRYTHTHSAPRRPAGLQRGLTN